MKKKHGVILMIVAFAMTGAFLFAQEEESGKGAKLSVTLDFNASLLSADKDGNIDSMTDAGFGEGGESTLSASYETESFGGTASLGFGDILVQLFNGEEKPDAGILSVQELYAWVKPFGGHFKFTAGIFENTDGVNDYTGDIDNFGMGVFFDGSEGNGFYTEPTWYTTAGLENGLLSEATFGSITAQLLLAPNFSKKNASAAFGGFYAAYAPPSYTPLPESEARLSRIGGRLIAQLPDVVTVAAMFKLESYPIDEMNNFMGILMPLLGEPFYPYPGTRQDMTSFGAYADITAIENLGVSLGYTGFTILNDDSSAKAALWNGLDLRATWTGVEGLSVSTHNNLSFASGEEWIFYRKDSNFFLLYNAVGLTKELNEKFSVNVELGNVYSKTEIDDGGGLQKFTESEELWGQLKLISRLAENTEFSAGLRVDYQKTEAGGEEETASTFSIPIGIKVSF